MSSAITKAYEDKMLALVDNTRKQLITALNEAATLSGEDKSEAGAAFTGAAIQLGAFCNAVAVALSGLVNGDMAEAVRECSKISNDCYNENLAQVLSGYALAKRGAQ
ncbi:hypothetical protein J5J86_14115 [Aquabacter sp. L1I39]|uniref:hypothetical protein n=1 Tax=Aquabacter sp. L1I39 TaxID=2820278 RepID=UPI001ADA7EC4|nr:hypothetical protein [Aquabacter sp. L1I39]QTL01941.1 hypothetical protein J5J86_14115 [Aquabacter sp. L1I39]